MPAPNWMPFSAQRTPVIDVGFVFALKGGKVEVRPIVASFTPGGVIYQDQRDEAFDDALSSRDLEPRCARLLV
jgi:hypothetical protein